VIIAAGPTGSRRPPPDPSAAATATSRCRGSPTRTTTRFAEIAGAATLPVLVDLWAPWCAPCRLASPALERLARELAGRIKLVKVNVDEAPRLAQRFDVRAVPTLLILRKGQLAARQAGPLLPPALRAWVEQALATGDP
jgi:thioredoxin 2